MKELYSQWMIENSNSNQSNTTKSGFLRGPNVETLLEWLKFSKKNLNKEHIITSFEKVGIISNSRHKEIFDRLKMNLSDLLERFTI